MSWTSELSKELDLAYQAFVEISCLEKEAADPKLTPCLEWALTLMGARIIDLERQAGAR